MPYKNTLLEESFRFVLSSVDITLNNHWLLRHINMPQFSCLEDPMDGGAWWAAVHGVMKSQTWLSKFTFTFHFHALEKEMATHSSVLDWRIPGMVGPGGLPSMGSHRVGHDWSDLAAAAWMLVAIRNQNWISMNYMCDVLHTCLQCDLVCVVFHIFKAKFAAPSNTS